MLNSLLFDLDRQKMEKPLQALLISQEPLRSLQKIVLNIRGDICHNNYPDYYFNKDSHFEHKEILREKTSKYDISILFEKDWESVCNSFLELCEKFVNSYISILLEIKNLPEKSRSEFVDLWLYYIESLYKRNIAISINVLTSLYYLSPEQKGKQIKKIKKIDIYKWISKKSNKNYNYKESCYNYIKLLLDKDLKNYLHSQDCPKPALPQTTLSTFFKSKVLY